MKDIMNLLNRIFEKSHFEVIIQGPKRKRHMRMRGLAAVLISLALVLDADILLQFVAALV